MGSEDWPEVRLADLCESIDYGYTQSACLEPVGPKFLRITDIVSGPIDWTSVPYCEAAQDVATKYSLRDGDIVIARTGATTGTSTYVQSPPDAVFASYLVRLQVDRSKAHPRFIAFYLRSPEFWDFIRGVLGDKSAQPNASAKTMTQATLRLPPMPEQRRIAGTLGALDDKIELNRRMNRSLESMARAIFKSWFVDFDPVRKKMEGKEGGEGGLPPALAALFPSSLGESPLGQIPTGWVVDAVGEFIDLRYGKALRAQDRQPGSVPVYGSNGQVGWHDTPLVSGPGIVVGRKGNPGTVSWVQRDFFPIDTSFYVRPKRDTADLHYLYHALDRLGLPSLSADSAVPGLNRESACHARLLKPPLVLTTAYGSFVKPLAERQAHVERESVRLTETRDALLPRLLDGTLHHAHQGRGVRCD